MFIETAATLSEPRDRLLGLGDEMERKLVYGSHSLMLMYISSCCVLVTYSGGSERVIVLMLCSCNLQWR